MAIQNTNFGLSTPSTAADGFPSSRFKSPSLPPQATAPSPSSVYSQKFLPQREPSSTMTSTSERRSISPPMTDRPEDAAVRDSPVSARSLHTPPLPQIPGSPTSMKPLPRQPPNVVHNTNSSVPPKNPERYTSGRMSNMTFRAPDKPFTNDKRRSNATSTTAGRRVESMAPSYTSTVTPNRHRNRTPGPFDRISTEPNFAQRVFDAGKADLLYEVNESTRWPWNFEDVKHGVLDLTTLARMQQHVLQQKLVAQVNALGQKGSWMEIGVGETMKEYCQVTRDMDYMTATAASRPSPTSNPFLISTTDTLEAQLLEEGGLIARKGGLTPSSSSSTEPSQADFEKHIARLPYAPEPISPWRGALRRWLAIISSAIALLLPFLIMMLVPSFASRMATTCGMIAVFALVAAASDIETRRAVAYVLGYGGLLVVFGGLVPPVDMWNGLSSAGILIN